MTPEERSLLERTYKMTEENNTILRKMRRSAWISNAMKIGYWVVIIVLSYGAYYFIQPYINAMLGALTEVQSLTGIKSNSVDALKGLLK